MSNQNLINELKTIIAHNEAMNERCYKLLNKLEGVSTSTTSKKGLDPKREANMIAKLRKTMYK